MESALYRLCYLKVSKVCFEVKQNVLDARVCWPDIAVLSCLPINLWPRIRSFEEGGLLDGHITAPVPYSA